MTDPETTKAYKAGMRAHAKVIPMDECPHSSGPSLTELNEDRYHWMIGWLDANTESILDRL